MCVTLNIKESVMQLERNKIFQRELKKLKKYDEENSVLEKILLHIKRMKNSAELKNHEISKLYNFEKLKQDFSGYYSFNLCKKRGVIRLICTIDDESNIVTLEYISMNHYQDFKNWLKTK